MSRTRTFVAVDISPDMLDRLVALQESLGRVVADVKWVEPANLHVTLLFLGEVDDREIPNVCRIVQDGVRERPVFSMSVEGLSCFGDPRRPRTLWVGVGEGGPELVAIHDALEGPLEALGYRREERRYTPHITLGRVRSRRPSDGLPAELARHSAWTAGTHLVREILVMGSELTKDGPMYTVLGRGKLR